MRIVSWAVLAAAILTLAPAPGLAGDEEESAPAMTMRLYGVSALVGGRTPFAISFPPVQPPKGLVREGPHTQAEPFHPLGMADELIELVRSHVAPAFWESTEGADMMSLGGRGLVVRATPRIHARIAEFLADLERQTLRTVAVDVQAVRLSAAALADLVGAGAGGRLDEQKVQRLLAGEARGPATRLVVENRSRGETFAGSQQAFLRRHEAVRPKDLTTTVPVAGVTNPGLAVSIQPIVHADGRSVRVRLDASWSGRSRRPAIKTARKETIELPAPTTLDVHTDVIVAPGVWSLAHAVTDGWSLLVRAVPGAGSGLTRSAPGLRIDVPVGAVSGAMELRNYDVASLAVAIEEEYGQGAYLHDTSYDGPPEEPEAEPMPAIGAEMLVELMRYAIGSERIWEDPASIEMRNGVLIVRQTPTVHAAIASLLDRLRRATPAVFATHVELIEVDAALRRRLLRTPQRGGDAWLLDDEARQALAGALEAGKAERLAGGILTSVHGLRNVLRSGRSFSYLSTYRPAKRLDALVIEPVTASGLSGFELDLRTTLSPGGRAVHLEARCVRTRLVEEVRTVQTAHGKVELPELLTLSVRSTLTAPLGSTAVVAVLDSDEREVLLLLTTRRQAR